MSELITRTARLVPYAKRPKQVPSFVTAFSYEPMADEPAAPLGSLYVVIEVLVGGRSSEEVADLVIQTFGERYYNNPEAEMNTLSRFEAAVKATNHELSEYVSRGNAAWIGKMSAIAAVSVGDEIHLTQTGSAEAFLYRHQATTSISGKGSERSAGPAKTFGSIASGTLMPQDRLMLATPALVHQIALARLHAIVLGGSPNSAIAEITDLLKGGQNERIAALIIEVTTPEQAALQVRSDEPDEIQLGSPDNALDAARMAAAPLAQATLAHTKRAGAQAKAGLARAKPRLQQAGYDSATQMRAWIAAPRARQVGGIALVVTVALVAWLIWSHGQTTRTAQLYGRYQADYQKYLSADVAANSGAKDNAQSQLVALTTELADLSRASGHNALDAKLKTAKLVGHEPASVAAFITLVSVRIDQLQGLVKVSPTTIANYPKNAKPNHLEFMAGKLYVFDSTNNSAIYVVNIATNSLVKSTSDTSKLGSVVATTLSSAGDGVFLITNQPTVWFYRFDNDSLTEQTINLGSWESGSAIASYATNLYVLSGQSIYKHVRTYSGYTPKSDYIQGLPDPHTIAVDGNVYVLGPKGLGLYLAGSLKTSAEVPASLANASTLRAFGGDTVQAISSTTKRIGFWDNHQNLIFSRQYSLSGIDALYDATYDPATVTGYALVNGRIVKYSAK